MVDPDAAEGREELRADGAHDVDGDTIPRSRLRAAWGPPEALDAVGTVEAPPVAPRAVVRDAPEPARPAERRTGPDLEHRIAPWAVPPAPPAGSAPGSAEPSPAKRQPAHAAPTDSRSRSHARFAPPRGAVDLAPDRPTPLTDPPRRRFWPWRRSAG